MSLDVSPELLQKAQLGAVEDAEFIDCVRTSLPYAWQVVSTVATAASVDGFADDETPPPTEAERGQLLRAFASNAIRGALERHFGVSLAFQNCHRVAAFAERDVRFDTFVSTRAQLLNQSPELRNC